MKKLNKAACFTDVHFGAKSNSELHNQDCIRFIDWFCQQVKKDNTVDHVVFLGDWHETRSAVNVLTLKYSYQAAKKLNDLGIPVFFIIGNHDLFHRHTREVHSTIHFEEFSNFTVIDRPILFDHIGKGTLMCPFMFDDEYAQLTEHLSVPVWFGHFEFKDFVVTGYNVKMLTGPDPVDFVGPKHIFCGHFHKRQTVKNIVYIGNTFPTTYADAGDSDRGMMIYDHPTDNTKYINWPDCPMYIKIKLSQLIDGTATILKGARVRCEADAPITFEESNLLRQTFTERYHLREFTLEEAYDLTGVVTETLSTVDVGDVKIDNIDELVTMMLNEIKSDQIDNKLLIKTYKMIPSC